MPKKDIGSLTKKNTCLQFFFLNSLYVKLNAEGFIVPLVL